MDQSDRLSLAQGAYIDSLPEGWVRRYTCSQIFSFFILKVGVRGLGSRPSLPVLVDVTSLPMISFRGEGFEVLSTIFHGYVMLLLTSYLATVARWQTGLRLMCIPKKWH